MKKLILALTIAVITLSSTSSWAYLVNVRPYVRSNGTVVGGHIRTSPNSTTFDNLGSW